MNAMFHRAALLMAGSLASFFACSAPSYAQLTNAGTFRNLTHEQTGPSTVVSTGAFFNAIAMFATPGEYDEATLTYPGAVTPLTLPMTSSTSFGIEPSFPSQADMDAAFPFGAYTITVTNSSTSASDSRTSQYLANAYTADIPALAAASFNALIGLSTHSGPLALAFNSFTPSSLVTSAYTFFSIFGTSQGCGFLDPSATSCTINPGALAANTTYDWELDFSDRIEATVDGALTYTDFDVRTDGSFTTSSVPEPSTWAMLLMGFAGLGYAAWRRNGGKVSIA